MNDEQESLPSSSSRDIIPANQSSSNSGIIPANQSLSSLDPIQASLYDKLKLAKTPEEAQSYLNLIQQRQEQIEQREYTNFQLSQGSNQIKYERKLGVYREIMSVVFSVAAIVLGLLTTRSIPLIAPLLIILGLIKPLGYSLGEVLELYRGLNQSRKPPQGETPKQQPKSSESSQ